MVSSSAIDFQSIRLAFRYALHYTAHCACRKHYTAPMTSPSIDIKKKPQPIVQSRERNYFRRRDYLSSLGERVREVRARRGLSRKQLAASSGVSERYLAQLEAGQGNISVLLLRQIATALDRPLTELLAEESDEAVELRSEEHTSELQSHVNLVCRLLLEKKKKKEKQDT